MGVMIEAVLRRRLWLAAGVLLLVMALQVPRAIAQSFERDLQAICSVQPAGVGHEPAREAVARLKQAGGKALFPILVSMKGASPLAKNWLRGAAGDALDGLVRESGQRPDEQLSAFFSERSNDPDARYLVYRWLTRDDEKLRDEILEQATDDPSLPLRYLAHKRLVDAAATAKSADPEEAQRLYERVLADARNPEQLRVAADALREMGRPVDLSRELGMIARWDLVGPFDSTNGQGFDLPLGPEEALIRNGQAAFARDATFAGKGTDAQWITHTTTDPMGLLDLNPLFDNAKDACCYAFCVLRSPISGEVEARLGSTNANKVWVNGQLVTANEVYHAGAMIDQYVGACELREGENWVLIKICQNAQTESWAQDWHFQFRITDAMGKPIAVEVVQPAQTEDKQ